MRLNSTNPIDCKFDVYLNGERVKRAVEADDLEGWVVVDESPFAPDSIDRLYTEPIHKIERGLVQFLLHWVDPVPLAKELLETQNKLNLLPVEWEDLNPDAKKTLMAIAIRAIQLVYGVPCPPPVKMNLSFDPAQLGGDFTAYVAVGPDGLEPIRIKPEGYQSVIPPELLTLNPLPNAPASVASGKPLCVPVPFEATDELNRNGNVVFAGFLRSGPSVPGTPVRPTAGGIPRRNVEPGIGNRESPDVELKPNEERAMTETQDPKTEPQTDPSQALWTDEQPNPGLVGGPPSDDEDEEQEPGDPPAEEEEEAEDEEE